MLRTRPNPALALLVLRFAVGAIFATHGYQKLFVMGHEGVTGFFTQIGVPMAGIAAWGISLLEFAGGLARMAGAFTRILAVLFVCDMIVAIALVLLPKGWGGYELEFLLASGSLAIVLAGAGAYSIDAKLARRDV